MAKENVVCRCKRQKEVSSTCNNRLDYTDKQLLRGKLAVTISVCVLVCDAPRSSDVATYTIFLHSSLYAICSKEDGKGMCARGSGGLPLYLIAAKSTVVFLIYVSSSHFGYYLFNYYAFL